MSLRQSESVSKQDCQSEAVSIRVCFNTTSVSKRVCVKASLCQHKFVSNKSVPNVGVKTSLCQNKSVSKQVCVKTSLCDNECTSKRVHFQGNKYSKHPHIRTLILEVRLIRFLYIGCLVKNQPEGVLKLFLKIGGGNQNCNKYTKKSLRLN